MLLYVKFRFLLCNGTTFYSGRTGSEKSCHYFIYHRYGCKSPREKAAFRSSDIYEVVYPRKMEGGHQNNHKFIHTLVFYLNFFAFCRRKITTDSPREIESVAIPMSR